MANGDHESELLSQTECQCPELKISWDIPKNCTNFENLPHFIIYFPDQPRTVVRRPVERVIQMRVTAVSLLAHYPQNKFRKRINQLK